MMLSDPIQKVALLWKSLTFLLALLPMVISISFFFFNGNIHFWHKKKKKNLLSLKMAACDTLYLEQTHIDQSEISSFFHSSKTKVTFFAPQETNYILQVTLSREDFSMTSRTLGFMCVPLPTDNRNVNLSAWYWCQLRYFDCKQ